MESAQNQILFAIRRACAAVGGQAGLARRLGVSTPTVNQWVSGKRQVPAKRCPVIEKATEGAVTCEQLRPDVDWAYLRNSPVPLHSPCRLF